MDATISRTAPVSVSLTSFTIPSLPLSLKDTMAFISLPSTSEVSGLICAVQSMMIGTAVTVFTSSLSAVTVNIHKSKYCTFLKMGITKLPPETLTIGFLPPVTISALSMSATR